MIAVGRHFAVLCLAVAGSVTLARNPVHAAPAGGHAKPRHVVSLNLCVDQLVLRLLPPARIASVTYLARRPSDSDFVAAAKRVAINHGFAEEIIAEHSDLVLASRYSARTAVRLLKALGYRVVMIPVARNLADIGRIVRRVAAVLGERAAGARLLADFDRRLAAVAADIPRRRPVAALYWPRGVTSGPGSLGDAILRAAGFANLAHRLGLGAHARLPLEMLLQGAPDAIITTRITGAPPSLATALLRHPALAALRAKTPTLAVPARQWVCGLPRVIRTIERLAELRRRIDRGRIDRGRRP